MAKYLTVYDAGYGENAEIIDADSQEAAEYEAYMQWKDAAESAAEYRAEPLTRDNAEEYGLEFEGEDE